MTPNGRLGFDALNAALKAAGEETRLRVLALLAEAELTVSDLTDILRQSQPRISRHLKLLAEAGPGRALPRGHLGLLPPRRAGRRRGGGAHAARPARSRRPDHRARPGAARLGAAGARRRRASLFPRACRRMGPHPQAARCRRGGRRRDPRGARRQAVPLASGSRHRHRPHARTVRRRRSSAGSASTSRSTCCCWRATGSSAPA